MTLELDALPGMGPRLLDKIHKAFGDEAGALEALAEADLQSLTRIDGVSVARAVSWCRIARGDDDLDAVFGTAATRRSFDAVIDRIRPYAATRTGQDLLRLIGPCSTRGEAEARARAIDEDRRRLADIDRDQVREALGRLRPIGAGRPVADMGLLVVASSDAVYERLHGMGVSKWARLGSRRDLAELGPDDLAIIVGDGIDTSGLEAAIEVQEDARLETICPESVLAPMRAAVRTLEALVALAEAYGLDTVADDALEAVAGAGAAGLEMPDLRAAVEALRPRMDEAMDERLAQLSLTGAEALRAIAAGRAPPAMERIQNSILAEARADLLAATGIDVDAFIPGSPLEIDEDAVRAALARYEGTAKAARFTRQQKAAAAVARLRERLEDEVRHWLRHDAAFALACFAEDHQLRPARIQDHFAFERSVHLDLAMDQDAQWIAYSIGEDHRAALLTGANSGGKSTLLEHLGQLALMARAGLPVVGDDVTVPWVEEVHLVTARKGLDAGALETFLRGFVPLAEGQAKRLVLADEVEAITELESAARILAFVLDRLTTTDSLAVVATHLAPQIQAHVAGVRIDGIEAKGLDDEHRLIVDRTPCMGRMARSTPELVVQRLAATTRGTQAALFAGLADCLATQAGPRLDAVRAK